MIAKESFVKMVEIAWMESTHSPVTVHLTLVVNCVRLVKLRTVWSVLRWRVSALFATTHMYPASCKDVVSVYVWGASLLN